MNIEQRFIWSASYSKLSVGVYIMSVTRIYTGPHLKEMGENQNQSEEQYVPICKNPRIQVQGSCKYKVKIQISIEINNITLWYGLVLCVLET